MREPMGTTKATKATATKASKREPRPKSLLSQEGDAAKLKAERALLLKTLRAEGFNLSATARALAMTDASSVLRALTRCGLMTEYEKHKP